MNTHQSQFSRRQFLQASGALGVGALLFRSPLAAAEAQAQSVPRKVYGRTGIEVSHVGFGAMFDTINAQVVLRTVYQHGVTYWDTAEGYERMGSETGIGMFFTAHPEARKQLFLVTKGRGDLVASLERSLGWLKTDHVDMFLVHGVDGIEAVDRPSVRAHAERMKKDGKTRFFGFSCHSNMAECLNAAAKLDWIDGVMFTYNYREMGDPAMQRALTDCAKAGVGLTAMKTLASRSGGRDTPAQAALLDPITSRGFTAAQAKLKVVLEDPNISVAAIQMPNMKFCRENIAAALDRRELGSDVKASLARHAEATCDRYCAGCSRRCGAAVADAVPVREVMRHLMYYHNYAELDARALFAEIPAEVRARLTAVDFAAAERACPHRLPIGQLMREAAVLLG